MMIRLKKISKKYDKQQVLKDIDVSFDPVGLVSIVGTTGAGKTTLLKIIGLLEDFNRGSLTIDGVTLKRFNERKCAKIRREKIGYISQEALLHEDMTVFQNLQTSIMNTDQEVSTKESIASVLASVGMKQFRHTKIKSLSGGQRQRISIARALLLGSSIIIADEPTASLDITNSLSIMRILRKLANEKLVIMVSHDQQLVEQFSDRILTILDGRILSDVANEKLVHDKTIVIDEFINLDNLQQQITPTYRMYQDGFSSEPLLDIIVKDQRIFLKNSNHSQKIVFVNDEIKARMISGKKEQESKTYEIEKVAAKRGFGKNFVGNWRWVKPSKILAVVLFVLVLIFSYTLMVLKNIDDFQQESKVPLGTYTIGTDKTFYTEEDQSYHMVDELFDEMKRELSDSYIAPNFESRLQTVITSSAIFGYSFVLGEYYLAPSPVLKSLAVLEGKKTLNPYQEVAISSAFLTRHKDILTTISKGEVIGSDLAISEVNYQIAAVFESDIPYLVGGEYSGEKRIPKNRGAYMQNVSYYPDYLSFNINGGEIAINESAARFYGVEYVLGAMVPFFEGHLVVTKLLDGDSDKVVSFISDVDYATKVKMIGKQSYLVFASTDEDFSILQKFNQVRYLPDVLAFQNQIVTTKLTTTLLVVLVVAIITIFPALFYLHSSELNSYLYDLAIGRLRGVTRSNIVLAITLKNFVINTLICFLAAFLSFYLMRFFAPMIKYPFAYLEPMPVLIPSLLAASLYSITSVLTVMMISFLKSRKTPSKMLQKSK